MPRKGVDTRLLSELKKRLGLSRRQIDRFITEKMNATFLPRPQAALALAAEKKIPISRFASNEDLATIRLVRSGAPHISTVVAQPAETSPAKISEVTPRKTQKRTPRRGTFVWVVYGRNEAIRKSIFQFLRAIGLDPIEWRKAILLTKKGSPFVAEILDKAFQKAVAVVVLLTPDDEARLRKQFQKSSDATYEKHLSPQARPNVLFEAGMAFGKNSESTILVQIGNVRPFSDVAGRHVVHLTNSPESRNEFATKLANAGCNVDTSGTDWLTEGDFEL